jgi:hypothetical protein
VAGTCMQMVSSALPAWDGSNTALAGCRSGFGRSKSGDFGRIFFTGYPKPAEPRPVPHKASQQPGLEAT